VQGFFLAGLLVRLLVLNVDVHLSNSLFFFFFKYIMASDMSQFVEKGFGAGAVFKPRFLMSCLPCLCAGIVRSRTLGREMQSLENSQQKVPCFSGLLYLLRVELSAIPFWLVWDKVPDSLGFGMPFMAIL
jgi:hypothetical protein